MKRKIIIIGIVLLLGCNKKKFFDGPNYYQDGFESYSELVHLLSNKDQNWSFTQLTKSGNNITVDTSRAHSGSKSLKFSAKQSDDILSKCSIAKQNMAFWEKETIRISGWYYLEGNASAQWLFLLDLEEQTPIGAGPGMRLALVDNKIIVEHKFYEKDLYQTTGQEINFPRDQWVNLVWEVKLSRKEKGTVKVWQDGQLIINAEKTKTLPKDVLYSQQGTKGMYSSVEIGITANSKDNDLMLWVDDVEFKKSE